MEWYFRAGKAREENGHLVSYYWNERASIIVLGENSRDGEWTMKLDYEGSIRLPNGDEGYKVLAFYSWDDPDRDLLEEAIDDLKQNYSRVKAELELYEHVPSYDDSRAGRLFCAGERIDYFNGCFVITTEYLLDI